MNRRAEIIREWCAARVGYPYVMGATNKRCTPSYRRERMEQYPSSAENIKRNCLVLSGVLKDCNGCPFEGKECFDCAQFTRYAMQYVGITLPSGATSQWNKTEWAERGQIANINRSTLCLVYRQDNPQTMGHTGVYTGDGYVIHAKGHAYGVVKEPIEKGKWTHYGIPKGLYDSITDNVDNKETLKERLETIYNELGLILSELTS